MNAIATKTTYTPEELLALPDEKDYELVDGHLVKRNMSRRSSWVAWSCPVELTRAYPMSIGCLHSSRSELG